MPKGFTRKDIADVQLDQRHARALDGIEQRDAGVRVGAGVEHDARQLPGRMLTSGFVDRIDQGAFVVALLKHQTQAMALAGPLAQLLHVGKRLRAVDLRLARAEKVQIGAVENVDATRHGCAIRRGDDRLCVPLA